MYETCDVIFTFKIVDAISHLRPYAEQGVRDVTELMETISLFFFGGDFIDHLLLSSTFVIIHHQP